MAGPLNEHNYTLSLRKANENTPAEISCRITCHDEDPQNKYKSRLYLGIMYAERAKEKRLHTNSNVLEPHVYDIHSETTSYCHHESNEINFVSYIYIFPQSPILLVTCSVIYDRTNLHETCSSPGIAVITYFEENSPTTGETIPPMSSTSTNATPTATEAHPDTTESTPLTSITTDIVSTTTEAISTTKSPNTEETETTKSPSTVGGTLWSHISALGTGTVALLAIIAALVVIIGIVYYYLRQRNAIPADAAPQQTDNNHDVIPNRDAVDEGEH